MCFVSSIDKELLSDITSGKWPEMIRFHVYGNLLDSTESTEIAICLMNKFTGQIC